MPRFAANLTMLFAEVPLLDRFGSARRAGFDAVEILFPYDHAAADFAARLDGEGLELALFNLPPGDLARGDRGLAALAGREADFDRALDQALERAAALRCRRLHVMSGVVAEGERARAFDTLAANLARAAPRARSAGVTLLIEPINPRDMPGYLVNRTAEARTVIEAVGAPEVRLQLDLYHRQIVEGDLSHALRDNADLVRHVQIAGPPDRHEPDLGEVNFPPLFALLDDLGFAGFVGCEYRPRGRTEDGLGWFAPWRR
jgi:hydroxypyruvate isomerase